MQIRIATTEDLWVLAKHEKHISKRDLENCLLQSRVYIAEDNNELVGWLRYNLFWDSIPFMNMLYLLDGNREKGIGTKLVEYWEAEMKRFGYKAVMASTASDEYAQHFYHKLGYATIGGFLLNQDPYEIILSKEL